jgi:hypothetical protein
VQVDLGVSSAKKGEKIAAKCPRPTQSPNTVPTTPMGNNLPVATYLRNFVRSTRDGATKIREDKKEAKMQRQPISTVLIVFDRR